MKKNRIHTNEGNTNTDMEIYDENDFYTQTMILQLRMESEPIEYYIDRIMRMDQHYIRVAIGVGPPLWTKK